ncbi:MAG: ATP synthase F1 subunit epsilon [Balneolaceae bacterium]
MAKTFHAQLLTPNGSEFDGEIIGMKVPGTDGNFEMLYNHAPIISTLTYGRVVVRTADDKTITFAVSGGFVEMNDNNVTLLAEEAIKAEQIDVGKAKEELEKAKKALQDKLDNREIVENAVKRADNLIKTALSK